MSLHSIVTGSLPTCMVLYSNTLRRPEAAIPFSAVLYLCLVRLLRFRRVHSLKRKYGDGPQVQLQKSEGKKARPVLGRPDVKMNPGEAQEIVLHVTQFEMPSLMRFSLVFSLFKTYAIPTISEILLRSKQLSTTENVSKRFADTSILIATCLECPFLDFARLDLRADEVDSRQAIAIARINWLHNRWPNIRNIDYLYTMSLFALQPIRWAKLYGWRELLPIEEEAFFVLWKEIGRRMNIQDIPDTLQELAEWSENYEETAMIPAESNYKVGQFTLDYISTNVPDLVGMRKIVRGIIICLMGHRARKAFMLPEPSPPTQLITRFVMAFFSIKSRYLDLPRFKRFEFIPRRVPAEKYKEKLPRFHQTIFDRVPWYKPEPKGPGWIWQNVLLKCGILEEEYVPGPKYRSEGYRLEECGPVALEQAGHLEVMKMAAELQGCPVSGIWARS